MIYKCIHALFLCCNTLFKSCKMDQKRFFVCIIGIIIYFLTISLCPAAENLGEVQQSDSINKYSRTNYDDDDDYSPEDEDDEDYVVAKPECSQQYKCSNSKKKKEFKPVCSSGCDNKCNCENVKKSPKKKKEFRPVCSSGCDNKCNCENVKKSPKKKKEFKPVCSSGCNSKCHCESVKKSAAKMDKMEYIFAASEKTCSLKLNYDISKKNEPLFMIKDSSNVLHLAMPNLVAKQRDNYINGIGAIQLDQNQSLTVVCPGKNNAIEIKSLHVDIISETEVKCVRGTKVSLFIGMQEQKLLDSTELVCEKPATSKAIFSKGKKPCGNGKGVIIELGFNVEGWHKLIDVCFNVEEVRTLYVTHVLHGAVLAGAVIDSDRPDFIKGQNDFYPGFDPIEYYKKENENEVIFELTGCKDYFNGDCNLYLAKGHFAPDADFLFKAWQDLTYFYVNVAPQWQSINQGYWLSVERLARKIAMKHGEEINVVTGSYGVMQLLGKDVRLKINQDKIKYKGTGCIPELAVPDYYWKMLHQPKTNECIVFVSINNPFIDNPQPFCRDICNENSWPELKGNEEIKAKKKSSAKECPYLKYKKGFVFCCSYEDFKKTVTYVPPCNCSGGILQGP